LTLTYSFYGEIAFPDRQTLQRVQGRPSLVVDDGTPLASAIAAKLGPSGVPLTFGRPTADATL
jgi:hypothetical protein